MEYVYKLDLPDIEEVLISYNNITSLTDKEFVGSKIFYPEPSNIFKSEWLSYKNLSWDYCSLFVRSGNQSSIIHRDNPFNSLSLHWGINWVYGKDSCIEFWEESDIISEKIIKDAGGKETILLEIDLPPRKTYSMNKGVYLINASKPHRIRNFSQDFRVALSLRSKKFRFENPETNWKDIVEMFENEIVKG